MKTYDNHGDAPLDAWFIISEARGCLFGQLDDQDGIWMTRKLPEDLKEDPEFELFYEQWQFEGVAKFLSGKNQAVGPVKWIDDDGHPCWTSFKDVEVQNGWVVVAGTGAGQICYRLEEGLVISDEMQFEGDDRADDPDPNWETIPEPGEPKIPFFFYEEFDDLIRFLSEEDGVEGGLAR